MAERMKDRTGQKRGRLTVIRPVGKYKNGKSVLWLCKCDCGNEKVVSSCNLGENGKVLSCGCLSKEVHSKHSMTKTRLHRIWSDMKTRCYNKNFPKYKYYGGKGIDVCREWKDDFIAFKDWAFANGYDERLTLDRIDGSIGYYPNNCRWVTMTEQANNKSSNVNITIDGVTRTATQWAKINNLPPRTVLRRIREGWSCEIAINTPVRKIGGNKNG